MKVHLPSLPGQSRPGTPLYVIIFAIFFFLISFTGYSQVTGDYRSKTTGNWSSLATWEYYNGANWVNATAIPGGPGYPGQKAPLPGSSVTIQTSHTVTSDVDVTAFVIYKLTIQGSGILNFTGNVTRQLNVQEITVVPGGGYTGPNVTFQSSQSAFRLPLNAFIVYPAGYNAFPSSNSSPNGSCNNNNNFAIGGGSFGGTEVKYSACNGGGNVCVTFTQLNAAGGTTHVTPVISLLLSSSQGANNTSCAQNFNALIDVAGVLAGSSITISLSGSGPSAVSFTPSTFGPIVDNGTGDLNPAVGTISVQTAIATGSPGVYTIQATANASGATGCSSFAFSGTNSVMFTVLPALNYLFSAPTSVCLSESAFFTMTNNGSLPIAVTYTVDGGINTQQNINATSFNQVAIPAVSPGVHTYHISEVKYQSPPAPPACPVALNTNLVVTVGDANSLAINGDTKTQNISSFPQITAQQGCRVIAKVENANAVTVVDSKAFVAAGPVVYSGRPMVGRRIMVHPVANNGTGADITIYALQSEFTAFNNSPINNIDLPYNAADIEGYKSNIRIIKFEEGKFDLTTGLPTVAPIGNSTEIVPSSVIWNAAKNWWEIKFHVNSFSLFIISNPTFVLLPLKLVSFDARLNGKRNASLSWTTTEEKNLSFFDVEASRDGILFDKVGEVEAKNLSTGGSYNFNTAMPGKLGYFRLKMVDKNGAFSYSPIKSLKTDELIISSYPNPVKDQLMVDLTGYPSGTIRIVDMNGRTLTTQKTVDGINRVNTSSFGNGLYILQVNVGLETEKLKFTKLNY